IKAEWRKSRLRPGFLIGAGVIAGITILVYAANWYLALHPLATRGGDRAIVSLATLYPDQFVNNVMGAAFPIGAAVAIVVGALFRQSAAALGIGLTYVLAVEIIAVRIINLINNGQFKNVTEQFVNQNATALTQSFTSPAFATISPPAITADHAVLVLAAWGI